MNKVDRLRLTLEHNTQGIDPRIAEYVNYMFMREGEDHPEPEGYREWANTPVTPPEGIASSVIEEIENAITEIERERRLNSERDQQDTGKA